MEQLQQIWRTVEVCSKCGAVEKFKKRRTMFINGQKRVYVTCKVCGNHAVRMFVMSKQ